MAIALQCPTFRYSLRSLFVAITLTASLLGWLGYHIRWKQHRQQAMATLEISVPLLCFTNHVCRTPWGLRLLGEEDVLVEQFFLPASTTDEEVARVASLFPEVDVQRR